MKDILLFLSLVICGALAEGPYPPSGWKPEGPSFELPERNPVDPRNKNVQPQKQEYLPPRTPGEEYGPPEVDVSVQGLPADEQLPIFQLSPVNGQQNSGPGFNKDLRQLDQFLNEAQLQAQRDVIREFARQRELEAAYARANSNINTNTAQPIPRQFTPTSTTTKPDDFKTTLPESTTELTSLNQGEVLNDKDKKEKVTVEVSKQNVQEYPAELYLSSLAQIQLANQLNPVQLGQIRAPIFLELQRQQQAYNPQASGVLAQQQLLQLQQTQLAQIQLAQIQAAQAQIAQAQAVPTQPQIAQYQPQSSSPTASTPAYVVPQDMTFIPQTQAVQPQTQFVQYQPQNPQTSYLVPQDQAFVPQTQVQPELASQYQPGQYASQYPQQQTQYQHGQYTPQAQYPQQPIFLQPQANQLLPRPQDQQVTEQDQVQPQLVYQYQYQPELQQSQQQPLNSYQQQPLQPQFIVPAQQNMVLQVKGRVPLQSGLNVNQQGNDIDQTDDDTDDGVTATAVATAFGTRTQPRPTYAPPTTAPVMGYQYPASTDFMNQQVPAENTPENADNSVPNGRRPAKIRSRQGRMRPVFTLDRSGHLVLTSNE